MFKGPATMGAGVMDAHAVTKQAAEETQQWLVHSKEKVAEDLARAQSTLDKVESQRANMEQVRPQCSGFRVLGQTLNPKP